MRRHGIQRVRGGFTIIELLIVVIVVGVLAAAGIGKYQGFAENARSRTCTLNQQTIENGVAMWCTQNTPLTDTGEGLEIFRGDGLAQGWSGTAAPFRDSWVIANAIREPKAFKCAKIIANVNNIMNNYPIGWQGYACQYNVYGFYYNGPGWGSWNGSGGFWYDGPGGATSHQIVWCSAYGGYNCDNIVPAVRKYIHSTRWGSY